MENIIAKQTRNTPEILFNPVNGELKLKGRLIPEDSQLFFKPLFDIIDDSKLNTFTFHFDLDYFNSSASKNILNILRESKLKFSKIYINWTCDQDDSDTIEFIESISEILNQEINIIKYKDE